jgi:hypothetical protein
MKEQETYYKLVTTAILSDFDYQFVFEERSFLPTDEREVPTNSLHHIYQSGTYRINTPQSFIRNINSIHSNHITLTKNNIPFFIPNFSK